MPAKPASNSLRCRKRVRVPRSSSSLNGSHRLPGSSRGMLSASQARARARYVSRSSRVSVLIGVFSSHTDQGGDAVTVLAGRAVHGPVDGDPSQVEVDVVVPGDADATVDLHAVLDQLGRVVTHVGLGDADQPGGVGGAGLHGLGGA